jgi:glycosyltransferase involved in cell wall biosynthesis
MKILSLSLDSSVLDKDSKLSKRVKEYKKLVERYTVITPDSKNKIIGLIKIFILSKKILKREKYNLITVQDPYYLALIGLFLKKQFKIGLEIQVHGWEKFYGLRKFIAKYVLPKADSIRTVSQRLKRELIEKFGVREEKIIAVPIFVERGTRNVERVTRNDRKFIFLTVGRLVPVKNIGLQIEVMKEVIRKYPSTELWIVGEGQEKLNLKNQISNLNLENNVKMFGWQNDLDKFYNQADAFLLTSDYEGWGMVVVEAASYGLPIIMTDVGCAGEIIKDEESGIVIPVGDSKKLAEAMLKVMEDDNLRNNLGAGARREIEKLPSKEETMRLYKESWEKAL